LQALLALLNLYNIVVFIISEHRTSCTCPKCGHFVHEAKAANVAGHKIETPRQLLYCSSCGILYQRDNLAGLNHFKLVTAIVPGRPRPASMCRYNVTVSGHQPDPPAVDATGA